MGTLNIRSHEKVSGGRRELRGASQRGLSERKNEAQKVIHVSGTTRSKLTDDVQSRLRGASGG